MKKTEKPLIITFFKENFASRTFAVPLSWVNQLGVGLILIAIVSSLSLGLAVRYFWIAQKGNPTQVAELESKIKELEAKLGNQKPTQVYNPNLTQVESPEPITTPSTAAVTPPAPITAPSVVATVAVAPVPIVTHAPVAPVPTQTAVQTNVAQNPQTVPASGNAGILEIIRGLNDKTIPQLTDIRIELEKPKLRIDSGHLFVDSAIRYVADDGEIQRGMILMLAHTTKGLVSYPFRALDKGKASPLIESSTGEFFAVGRYREVHGEFGAIHNLSEIKQIEILIISSEKKPLILETVSP